MHSIVSLVVRGETLADAQSNWARKRSSGQAGGWNVELVPDKRELSGKVARARRHIPPITDDNFEEEWHNFEMDPEASEDDDIAKAESCGNDNLSRESRTAAAIEVPIETILRVSMRVQAAT